MQQGLDEGGAPIDEDIATIGFLRRRLHPQLEYRSASFIYHAGGIPLAMDYWASLPASKL